jgi:hypothetical protein
MSGYRPKIPSWVFERYSSKEAFQSDPKTDAILLNDGRDSISALLPTFITYLRKTLGDRYSMNASATSRDIFYFFEPPHPIDSVAVHLGVRGGRLMLNVSYLPQEISGNGVNLSKIVEDQAIITDPDMAGLFLMRLIKKILSKVLH